MLTTSEQCVHMAALRRARAIERVGGQAVALKDHHTLGVMGKRARGRQAGQAGTDDDRLFADISGHHTFSAGPLKLRDLSFFVASITVSDCINIMVASS